MQAGWKTNKQTYKQDDTDRQSERQTYKLKNKYIDRQTDSKTNRQTDKQKDTQTGNQRDKQSDLQAGKHSKGL